MHQNTFNPMMGQQQTGMMGQQQTGMMGQQQTGVMGQQQQPGMMGQQQPGMMGQQQQQGQVQPMFNQFGQRLQNQLALAKPQPLLFDQVRVCMLGMWV